MQSPREWPQLGLPAQEMLQLVCRVEDLVTQGVDAQQAWKPGKTGKSSLGKSLLLTAFSDGPWGSTTETTNARGMAGRSRRVAVGLGTAAGAGMDLPRD